jgi:hypothetical protein
MTGDANMNDLTRAQIDEKEAEQAPKQQVRDLKEVTRPDVFGMVVQEGQSILGASWRGMDFTLVALNGAFADANAQFQ